MGALCTSDANRGLHEDGRRHPNTDQSSSKPSRTNQQTSMAKNAALNNVVLDQIRNSPDDPNLIIINDLTLSNHASQNNNNPPLNYHQSYTSFSPMMSPTRQLSNDSVTEKDTMLQLWCNDINDIYLPPQQTITIGDEIELTARYNSLHGVVKFIGEIVNATGVFYGIELNKPKGSDEVFQFRKLCNGINGFDANQNTGHIDNVCYFTSDAHEALFVHKGQIGRILKVNYDMPRLGIHSQIYLPQYKCNGTVKYIGRPHHMHLIYYGIELDIGYGVYLDCTELSHWILPSRYNLLLHGFVDSSDVNIPSGIVKLIKHYHNKMEIRLTSVPQRIGDSIKVICKKYEPFDIDNNICGPAITIRCTGCFTHNTDFATVIAGYYQFAKTCSIDSGDYNTPWVHKTEFQIMQLKDGDRERIFRAIDCDNEIPLMMDCKSIRCRFRHNIHADDVDVCDHKQILEHIAQLYGATSTEIRNEFEKYGIELYGLRY